MSLATFAVCMDCLKSCLVRHQMFSNKSKQYCSNGWPTQHPNNMNDNACLVSALCLFLLLLPFYWQEHNLRLVSEVPKCRFGVEMLLARRAEKHSLRDAFAEKHHIMLFTSSSMVSKVRGALRRVCSCCYGATQQQFGMVALIHACFVE